MLPESIHRLRRAVGAAVLDIPQLLVALGKDEWPRIVNRRDETSVMQAPLAVRVLSDTTSSLHASDVFPRLGRTILRAAIRHWRFTLAEDVRFSDHPDISFIIPCRGVQRRPQLEAVIRSIAALGDGVECIVVEQDQIPRLQELPGNTRYLHVPHPQGDDRWHKCLAHNEGARQARGRILVFHDGDLLVPERYAMELRRLLIEEKLDVAFPQRFLFYLDKSSSQGIQGSLGTDALANVVPEHVKQNWVGGTAAVRADVFREIGGYDERFVGWTGEDREFFDRCQAFRGFFHGYVPFVHLWHPSQQGKHSQALRDCDDDFVAKIMSVPRAERILVLQRSAQ